MKNANTFKSSVLAAFSALLMTAMFVGASVAPAASPTIGNIVI